jgi:hypothetical protein
MHRSFAKAGSLARVASVTDFARPASQPPRSSPALIVHQGWKTETPRSGRRIHHRLARGPCSSLVCYFGTCPWHQCTKPPSRSRNVGCTKEAGGPWRPSRNSCHGAANPTWFTSVRPHLSAEDKIGPALTPRRLGVAIGRALAEQAAWNRIMARRATRLCLAAVRRKPFFMREAESASSRRAAAGDARQLRHITDKTEPGALTD